MEKDNKPLSVKEKNSKTLKYLLFAGIGMFGFAFALVPLYQLACKVGGINGIASDTGRVLAADIKNVDKTRWVTVQFDATINKGLPWNFYPEIKSLKVHPGQNYQVNYFAENKANYSITGQAIPGVTPWQATKSFHKIECFCFTQQTLEANEKKKMPLNFVIDPDLPKEYETVTLSYTFMNMDRKAIQKPDTQASINTEALAL